MKIIHTADWHLGQTFFEYDRKGEHSLFMTWLREQVKVHEVDVLFIAGNYDSEVQLKAFNSLLESMNVTMWGIVKRTEGSNIDFDHLIVPLGKREYSYLVSRYDLQRCYQK